MRITIDHTSELNEHTGKYTPYLRVRVGIRRVDSSKIKLSGHFDTPEEASNSSHREVAAKQTQIDELQTSSESDNTVLIEFKELFS